MEMKFKRKSEGVTPNLGPDDQESFPLTYNFIAGGGQVQKEGKLVSREPGTLTVSFQQNSASVAVTLREKTLGLIAFLNVPGLNDVLSQVEFALNNDSLCWGEDKFARKR